MGGTFGQPQGSDGHANVWCEQGKRRAAFAYHPGDTSLPISAS
jgi:hypothetical protein